MNILASLLKGLGAPLAFLTILWFGWHELKTAQNQHVIDQTKIVALETSVKSYEAAVAELKKNFETQKTALQTMYDEMLKGEAFNMNVGDVFSKIEENKEVTTDVDALQKRIDEQQSKIEDCFNKESGGDAPANSVCP